jgi:hypothetical protein
VPMSPQRRSRTRKSPLAVASHEMTRGARFA